MRAAETIIAVLAILVLPATAGAQVTATQGTAPPPQEQHFASPMILDLPFPNVTKLEPGSTLRLAEVYRYVCDNHVRLRSLRVTKQHKGPRKSPALHLVISGQIFVADSYDRRVDIGLKLLNPDGEIATQTLRNVKAEEGRATLFKVYVPADEAKLSQAHVDAKPPTLQLTVTVHDDS